MSTAITTPPPCATGDAQGAHEILPLVYEELRKLALSRMAEEADTSTLQPTALVHEAWLRLNGPNQPAWKNRSHFFGAAAEAMRRILIERARRKRSLKRGASAVRIDLENVDLAIEADDDLLLAIDEALEKLAVEDPQSAQLVKLRFFVGMSYEEAARTMNISPRTAKRCWSFSRAWLYRELSARPGAESPDAERKSRPGPGGIVSESEMQGA